MPVPPEQVMQWAQEDLSKAQQIGDQAGMARANGILQKVRGMRQSQASPQQFSLGGRTPSTQQGRGEFDPLSYISEFFTKGPWGPGTRSLDQIKQEADLNSQALDDKIKVSNQTGMLDGQKTVGYKNQLLEQLLATSGMMGSVQTPKDDGLTEILNMFGLKPGAQTADMYNAQQDRANRLAVAGMNDGGGSGSKTNKSYLELIGGIQASLANSKDPKASVESAEQTLKFYYDAGVISAEDYKMGVQAIRGQAPPEPSPVGSKKNKTYAPRVDSWDEMLKWIYNPSNITSWDDDWGS